MSVGRPIRGPAYSRQPRVERLVRTRRGNALDRWGALVRLQRHVGFVQDCCEVGGNHGVRHLRMFAGVLFPSVGTTLVANPGILRRARRTHGGFVTSPGRRLRMNAPMAGKTRTTSSMLSREATLATGQPAGSAAMRWSMFRPTRSVPTDHSSSSCRTCSTARAIRDSISFRDHPQVRAPSIWHCSAPSMAVIEPMAFVETWNSSNGLVRLSCCRAAYELSAESARTARPFRNAWLRNPPLRSAGSSRALDSRIGALQCWYSAVFGFPNTAARRTRKPATAL